MATICGHLWYLPPGFSFSNHALVTEPICREPELRAHARDPGWQQDVIRLDDGDHELHWGRWSHWHEGDPRWRVHVIDTSGLPVAHVANEIAAWIMEERKLLRTQQHPLALWAEDARSRS